jgi:hypothetical protein
MPGNYFQYKAHLLLHSRFGSFTRIQAAITITSAVPVAIRTDIDDKACVFLYGMCLLSISEHHECIPEADKFHLDSVNPYFPKTFIMVYSKAKMQLFHIIMLHVMC